MAPGTAQMHLDFRSVGFQYDSQPQPLLADLTLRLGRGFTGIVGPNGCGKSTLLLLAVGRLQPTAGHVRGPDARLYCAQRTDAPPDDLPALLAAPDGRAAELVGRLGLDPSWAGRWDTLSHGERKRAQIACALWRDPGVLAIDEPTNHVDAATRAFLAAALRGYRGIGLLVSHDRELLDALCAACVMFEHGRAVLRPGGYTQARAAAERELEALRREKENAKRAQRALAAAAADRRREADRADAKRSKRHLARGDSDGRGRIDLARVSGKDGQAGRLLRQLEGRLRHVSERAESLFVPKRVSLGVELRGEVARRPVLARLDAGDVALSPSRTLRVPSLEIANDDRVGVAGPNGSGKSTLVRRLLDRVSLESDRLLYIPQEIDAARSRQILDASRRLDPLQLGAVMGGIAALGSDPRRVLTTELPSPGELRKLMLALGLSRRPHLVVMDEPTNHLDLPSIECLESALSECRCALLLVSHDAALLDRTTRTRWTLTPAGGDSTLTIQRVAQADEPW